MRLEIAEKFQASVMFTRRVFCTFDAQKGQNSQAKKKV